MYLIRHEYCAVLRKVPYVSGGKVKTEMYCQTGKLDFKMFSALRQSLIHSDVYTKNREKKLCFAFISWIDGAQGEV